MAYETARTNRLDSLLSTDSTRQPRSLRLSQIVLLPISITATLITWQGLIWLNDYPAFILPSPFRVWERTMIALADGLLFRHTVVTLGEALGGLAAGLSVAATLGYFLAQSRTIERLIAPYVVASQSIPVVAIAPLLVIWFGSGITSKVLICALIVFFPVLINVIVGVRSVEADLRDMMRSLRASRWQTFVHLELPAAMPLLLGGLKIGATLSVIGAVVGEFVGANSGLGFLITVARGQFDTPLVFAAVIALVAIAMAMYGAVALLEKYLLAWKN
ncbi:MAG TPA: ABC transporter permease [Anaerolineales bacterium]|nr:ABC transporter permease [Anaerolineales bacterium]